MKLILKILTTILICSPLTALADVNLSGIDAATNETELNKATNAAFDAVANDSKYANLTNIGKLIAEAKQQTTGSGSGKDSDTQGNATAQGNKQDGSANGSSATKPDADNTKKATDAQKAYEEAKANQQSLANRTLTAVSVATMGIGAAQLAQGLSEKQADAAADKDMAAYMASMRCSYGDGQSVHMGPDSIELPTSDEIRAYRAEYLALAESLKFRKEALGLKPGIESEVIINKENTGLYDDQNTGITSGAYASRYRAKGGNEEDQKGLAADKKEAKTRMIAGGVIAGAGLVGSVIGNAVINGKSKSGSNLSLGDLKKLLKKNGYANADKLSKDDIDKLLADPKVQAAIEQYQKSNNKE